MSGNFQTRALKKYRKRLDQCGMARFEALEPVADGELIPSMARKLADNSPEAPGGSRLIASKNRSRAAKEGRHPCAVAPFAIGWSRP